MSLDFDNQATVNTNNFDSTPSEKKGGKRKWIFIGCGCMGLLMLLCVGGVVGLGWYGASMAVGVTQDARSFVENSTVVQQHLGSPVVIQEELMNQGPDQALEFEYVVVGPNGEGTARVTAKLDEEKFEFVIIESSLEVNGEVFDLNSEDEFNMDVEGMDDF